MLAGTKYGREYIEKHTHKGKHLYYMTKLGKLLLNNYKPGKLTHTKKSSTGEYDDLIEF